MLPRLSNTQTLGSRPKPLWPRARRVLLAGVAGGAVVTALGLGVHEVRYGPSWEVQQVIVSGNHQVSDVAVRHLADLRHGTHLFGVDLDRAVSQVERHPWIRHAEARRAFPGTVEITVTEYEPALLLAVDALWYVDSTGRPFHKAGSEDLDYPVLTGLDPVLVQDNPRVARRVIDHALAILDASRGRPEITPDRISEIHLDAQRGFELILRNGSRLLIGFGEPTERFDRLERLFASGLALDPPARVDLAGQNVAIATPLKNPT